ncbi:hypothetical protein IW261DRAFT_1419521 [Armillaria novae-zelandiae]|uniref:Uncharacterized protein n=1 Tax=Armillaria novae-zelandiae TaxID=153914 RepID=A0AA39P9Y4_9AGAR|nr:hypothetical protein IW261DRAFT_1419521 [Armillaria novae-zelandiae]
MARGTEMRERHPRKGTATTQVFYRDSIELEVGSALQHKYSVQQDEHGHGAKPPVHHVTKVYHHMPGDDDGPICTASSLPLERLLIESSEIVTVVIETVKWIYFLSDHAPRLTAHAVVITLLSESRGGAACTETSEYHHRNGSNKKWRQEPSLSPPPKHKKQETSHDQKRKQQEQFRRNTEAAAGAILITTNETRATRTAPSQRRSGGRSHRQHTNRRAWVGCCAGSSPGVRHMLVEWRGIFGIKVEGPPGDTQSSTGATLSALVTSHDGDVQEGEWLLLKQKKWSRRCVWFERVFSRHGVNHWIWKQRGCNGLSCAVLMWSRRETFLSLGLAPSEDSARLLWECDGTAAALRSYLDIRIPTHRITLTRALTATHVERGKWHSRMFC